MGFQCAQWHCPPKVATTRTVVARCSTGRHSAALPAVRVGVGLAELFLCVSPGLSLPAILF